MWFVFYLIYHVLWLLIPFYHILCTPPQVCPCILSFMRHASMSITDIKWAYDQRCNNPMNQLECLLCFAINKPSDVILSLEFFFYLFIFFLMNNTSTYKDHPQQIIVNCMLFRPTSVVCSHGGGFLRNWQKYIVFGLTYNLL